MTRTVVLLHGLARSQRSMAGLRRHLEASGFRTWSCTYPSRHMGLADLAKRVSQQIRADLGDLESEGGLLAVTHSLGGILVRHMGDALPWRGVVMLAPPNQGSRVARALHRLGPYRWYYGPAGQEVVRPPEPEGWPPPPRPFAVIAGTRALSLSNPTSWLTRGLRLLPSQGSDGTVALNETQLPGMADFRTVAAGHTFIMDHPQVRAWIVQFLREGRFT